MGTAAAKDTEDANNVYLKTTAEGQRPCPAADPEEFFIYVPEIWPPSANAGQSAHE